MKIARKSAKTVLKDYQKSKIDIEEMISENMLAKQQQKNLRKGTGCLKEN